MTKKKKPKRSPSGKRAWASPSSSASTQSSGASKQSSFKIPASSSQFKLDLAASVEDGSVDLPISDLPLETSANAQITSDIVEPSTMDTSLTLSIPATATGGCPQDPPITVCDSY
ncbi:hypothetical protein F2Q69_00053869 [Brassica cretica]|uniref:Uncharacterized protein n=1 Tax=Brassica cretica TaxID=69181 RepID=A0A8S9MZ44_BRACR|nr:hypothetical protein F2Q69_00053869 [Brassica cretica]